MAENLKNDAANAVRVDVIGGQKWTFDEQQLRSAISALATAMAIHPAVRQTVADVVNASSRSRAAAPDNALRNSVALVSADAARYFRRNIAAKTRTAVAALIHESVIFAQLDSQHAPNDQTFHKLALEVMARLEEERLSRVRFRKSGKLSYANARALLTLVKEGEPIFRRFAQLRRSWHTDEDAVAEVLNDPAFVKLPPRRRRILKKIVRAVPQLRPQDKGPKNLAKMYAVMVLEPKADEEHVSLRSVQRRFRIAEERLRQASAHRTTEHAR